MFTKDCMKFLQQAFLRWLSQLPRKWTVVRSVVPVLRNYGETPAAPTTTSPLALCLNSPLTTFRGLWEERVTDELWSCLYGPTGQRPPSHRRLPRYHLSFSLWYSMSPDDMLLYWRQWVGHLNQVPKTISGFDAARCVTPVTTILYCRWCIYYVPSGNSCHLTQIPHILSIAFRMTFGVCVCVPRSGTGGTVATAWRLWSGSIFLSWTQVGWGNRCFGVGGTQCSVLINPASPCGVLAFNGFSDDLCLWCSKCSDVIRLMRTFLSSPDGSSRCFSYM